MKKYSFILLLFIFGLSKTSYSQVKVKNTTRWPILISIEYSGIEDKSTFKNVTYCEGWWRVEPGEEKVIKSNCPKSWLLYYAKVVPGAGVSMVWEGNKSNGDYGVLSDNNDFKVGLPNRLNRDFDDDIQANRHEQDGSFYKIFRHAMINIVKGVIFDDPPSASIVLAE